MTGGGVGFGVGVQPKPLKARCAAGPILPQGLGLPGAPQAGTGGKQTSKLTKTHHLGPGVETAERPWHFLAMWLWESHFPHLSHSFLSCKEGWVH